jgi:hypothetical protein
MIYKFKPFDGCTCEFELDSYSPAESVTPPSYSSMGSPGCDEEIIFSYALSFDDVNSIDELQFMAQEIEGMTEEKLHKMMLKHYEDNNKDEPEPDCDHDGGWYE